MASSSLPLPLSPPRSWEHDVFPSFHGRDVRKGFFSHIKKEFERNGITPFIDNNIKRGESIGPELKRAIQESKIAVVLLSKNYASSSWCLDELVEIMSKVEGQTVLTIFYKVDPTDVRKQTGYFGKVFEETCQGKTKEITETWIKALEAVAKIAGYHSSKWDNDAAMIEKIADDISKMLNGLAPSPDILIGMGARMEEMKLLLRLDLENEVRMIGVWGPPGIGKSTIVRFLFNQFYRNFPLSAIMVNIKGSYPRPCLDEGSAQLQLQNQMLSLMFNHKDTITHLGVAPERLKNRRVLLVLDDVDRRAQLNALAGGIRWFGPGSRIIITTEDLRVLNGHGIKDIYKMDYPIFEEALQIFCIHAFGQKSPYDGFEELAREVTQRSGKLPLGLRVMGSYFQGMSKDDWTKALPNLRDHLNGEIESILMFSYEALSDIDKDLFLHIACFFNFERVDKMEEHLAKKFLNVRQRLQVLVDKSLISYERNWIEMHTLLAQLGEEIVRKQSDREPGKRQFLVDDKDICKVLTNHAAVTRSRSVIGISSREGGRFMITKRAFAGMLNLQFLRLRGNIQIVSWRRRLKYISPNLQLLDWSYSQMTSLRCIIYTEFLVELNMPHSKLKKLWEGIKPLPNLKWMNLGYSTDLKKLPNLSTATNLQELDFTRCSSLVKLPSSIGNATDLQKLYLTECLNLVELPSSIGNATNLQILDLSWCSKLVKLPSSIGNATKLQELHLSWCSSLVELPSSIGNATNLQELNLSWGSSLVELPSSIGNATNLQKLNLSRCSSLVKLPSSIGNATNLQELNLSRCLSLVELPSSIGNANFKILDLSWCLSLVELPSSIGNATNLQKLNLSDCSNLMKLPSSIGNATNLQELNLNDCSSLLELPSSIGNATNLPKLCLRECLSLVELPSSIGNATNLQELNLSRCSNLVELPSSIGNANFKILDLSWCSSLVELPSSVGNLQRLKGLVLLGCSKLKVIPTNIKLESLVHLNLTYCSSLKRFPEISTNIELLMLSGSDSMSYYENLKEYMPTFESITELRLVNIQEIGPWVRGCSRLEKLDVSGCEKLVSIPQLPDSILQINAENCESLERLDCSFRNPKIYGLNFGKCYKLNQDAKYLIIQTPTRGFSVLPGGNVPECFTYRASGSSLTVKLDEKPLRTSIKFKVCILLVDKGTDKRIFGDSLKVECIITTKQNALTFM